MRKIKKVGRKIARLVVSGTLVSSSGAFAAAPAGDALENRSGAGDAATVYLRSLPSEVRSGSIRISEHDHDSGLSAPLALVSADEAVHIATRATAASALGAELDVENGFLVWAIEVQSRSGNYTALIVDAGNGQVLALESG